MRKIKYFLTSGLLAIIIFATSSHAESSNNIACQVSGIDDGAQGRENAINLVTKAFLQEGGDKNFEKLDELVAQWKSMDCKLLDGRQKLNFLLFGFKNVFDNETDWGVSLKRVQALNKARPKSAYASLAEAQYWVSYAWNARGTGFASSVPPEKWILFRERLAIAEKVLLDSKTVGTTLPNWYDLMISIEGTLDRTEQQRERIFLEGATRYKTFLPLYIPKRNLLEPKWGGSWEAVDEYINWVVNNTKDTEKQSMYARLYYGVRDNMLPGTSFFRDTRVQWTKLKKGFEDLIELYPNSKWHLNSFAAVACEADDKSTYIALRRRIGTNFFEESWSKNYPRTLCDAKYRYTN